MKWIALIAALTACLLVGCNNTPTTTLHPEWEPLFRQRNWQGTFVVENVQTGNIDCYNPQRADKGYLPASTFKIVNSLIALQTGVLNPDTLFRWDGVPRRLATWDRDMTLSEAFQASCVPVFQGIARQVGPERMQHWCDTLRYGHMVVADSLDNFWLEGRSAVSAREQAEFVARLARRELPLRPEVMDRVANIMLLEEQPGYRIYGKTGTSWEGYCWLVGWIETEQGAWSYALNFDPSQPDIVPNRAERRELIRDIFVSMGVL